MEHRRFFRQMVNQFKEKQITIYLANIYIVGVADQSFGNSHENYGKFNRFKKRKRKPFKYPNSTEPSVSPNILIDLI